LSPQAGQQIIAIEQPELHLHPAYQANLADLFVSAVHGTGGASGATVLLETHSEVMIGRLGELVAAGRIRPDDVAIHFVEKDEESGLSQVRLGEFSTDGVIENWPVGFFSARA
jgi:predicted ATPase